jgi:hypothetical protein
MPQQNYEEVELTEQEYEDMLDEIYGEVQICGMTFNSGRALRELDPTAFRCGMADEPQKWKCLGCDRIYEDEDEAAECCPLDDAEEVSDTEQDKE